MVLALVLVPFISSSQISCTLELPGPLVNGACDVSYAWDEDNNRWIPNGAWCIAYAKNAFGVHDCRVENAPGGPINT